MELFSQPESYSCGRKWETTFSGPAQHLGTRVSCPKAQMKAHPLGGLHKQHFPNPRALTTHCWKKRKLGGPRERGCSMPGTAPRSKRRQEQLPSNTCMLSKVFWVKQQDTITKRRVNERSRFSAHPTASPFSNQSVLWPLPHVKVCTATSNDDMTSAGLPQQQLRRQIKIPQTIPSIGFRQLAKKAPLAAKR